jgi:histidinol dehydrogenase
MLPKALIWSELDALTQQAVLQRPAMTEDAAQRALVHTIVQQVRSDGDAAIAELTLQYDRVALDDFRVSDAEITLAESEITKTSLAAIDLAIENVRRFHSAQTPPAIFVETMPGVRCERFSQPIDSVGLYVPAGTAPLPSAAIMLAVPAAIANCPVRIMCTPPRADGRADPAVLVAATRAGVRDIFKIGGAQAIAAMAYGSESVPKVCKIFGPGNSWVTLAKSIVSSDAAGAAIDLPAGPSEVLVIADESASAEFVAADLLSQAEHGADSQVVLVSTSAEFAARVSECMATQLSSLSRSAIATQALLNARNIIVANVSAGIEISNAYAPEHLIMQTKSPRKLLPQIRNAGSVFLGPWSPESVGDYCSGTNHVLPTHGFARAYSGLGVDQFLRQTTVQELTEEGLKSMADAVIELARLEGLDAHAAAVGIRQGRTQ